MKVRMMLHETDWRHILESWQEYFPTTAKAGILDVRIQLCDGG